MPAPKFLMWGSQYIEGKCVLMEPKGMKDGFELSEGVPRQKGWPDRVVCAMNPEFAKDLELADNMFGTSLVIISKKLRDVLTDNGVIGVEFLPVQVMDHKKKLASADYFILNPPSLVDCIDIDASQVKFSPLDPETISRCNELVLKEAAVPKDVKVFRPKFLSHHILVRADLAGQHEHQVDQEGVPGGRARRLGDLADLTTGHRGVTEDRPQRRQVVPRQVPARVLPVHQHWTGR